MKKPTVNIGLIGAYRISDGYPNVKWLLSKMHESSCVNIFYGKTKENENGEGLFNQSKSSKLTFIFMIIKMAYDSASSFIRCLYYYHHKKIDLIYAPYPAHISLFFLSLLPKRIRPPVILDGFISLYDSAVLDRKVLNKNSFLSKALYWFEKRALSSSTLIICDTSCSAIHISDLLNININKFVHIPLMTDEENYRLSNYKERKTNKINIVFIGTFVPLQGVATIAKAAHLLAEDSNIHFTIVGSGQTSNSVNAELLKSNANINWIKTWQSPENINDLINSSDICLGIFGGSEKAARVWPFKNYASMRIGRAIISQETICIPYQSEAKEKPFIAVPPEDSKALAFAIKELARSFPLRKKYADLSKKYYENHLSNDEIFNEYFELFYKLKKK